MLEVAVWSIQPDIREMGMPDEAISPATEHALICSQRNPLICHDILPRVHMHQMGTTLYICCIQKSQLHLIKCLFAMPIGQMGYTCGAVHPETSSWSVKRRTLADSAGFQLLWALRASLRRLLPSALPALLFLTHTPASACKLPRHV